MHTLLFTTVLAAHLQPRWTHLCCSAATLAQRIVCRHRVPGVEKQPDWACRVPLSNASQEGPQPGLGPCLDAALPRLVQCVVQAAEDLLCEAAGLRLQRVLRRRAVRPCAD